MTMTTSDLTTAINELDLFLAETKLLQEMEEEHTRTEDVIHNYLCDAMKNDAELIEGINTDGKTIKGAINFMGKRARDLYSKGQNVAAVEDKEVFEWVREYYLTEEIEEIHVPVEVTTGGISTTNVEGNSSNYQVPEHVKKRQEKQRKENELFGVTGALASNFNHSTSSKENLADGQLDMFADLFGGEE